MCLTRIGVIRVLRFSLLRSSHACMWLEFSTPLENQCIRTSLVTK